jgi:serine/threonine protein kinase
MWSTIRHPNILRESVYTEDISSTQYLVEFLGANILDDKPFIVMPYLPNGNARDYLLKHPNGDRLKIVCTPNVTILQCPTGLIFNLTCTAARYLSRTRSPPLTPHRAW